MGLFFSSCAILNKHESTSWSLGLHITQVTCDQDSVVNLYCTSWCQPGLKRGFVQNIQGLRIETIPDHEGNQISAVPFNSS